MIQEVYKQYKDTNYQVSNLGNIKNIKSDKILVQTIGNTYKKVDIYHNKLRTTKRVHNLVAEVWLNHVPNKSQKIIVDHIDNNPLNNKVSNLQLISQRDNVIKSTISNTGVTGIHYLKSKLKYMASIKIKGKSKQIGCFDTLKEAKESYEKIIKY